MAGRTVHDLERLGGLVVKDRVSVRVNRGGQPGVPGRVSRLQPPLQLGARCPLPARQADDPVQAAVQFGHPKRTRRLVQAVDVLRDDPAQHARLLQSGYRPVPGVGPRGDDPPPADVSAGPVALASLRRAAELSDLHRQPGAQRAARTAIVRNSRLSRQARARQHAHTATTNKLTKPARHDAIHRLSMPTSPRQAQG